MGEFKYIEVQKSRDLGQILNASFSFMSQNFKNLSLSVLYIGGLPLLISILYNVFVQWDSAFNIGFTGSIGSEFFITFLGSFIINMVALVFITLVPVVYIKIYIEKKSNDISIDEVWAGISPLFFRVFFADVVVAIITVVALLFIVIPGVYVAVIFSLVSVIIAIEGAGLGQAMGRSSRLINGRWWFTFGLLIVITIITYALSFIFQIPTYVTTFTLPFIYKDANLLTESFWLLRVMSGFGQLSSFFYAFYSVGLTFHYFSLVEQKEATGLFNKIDALEGANPVSDASL
ncbi:MAG: hypothetical protein JXR46_06575 [Calditrichaceae bacterium]|nr:hypothetical protein [Calditrichaceae bacterium]MBN2708693.1 hypothetical protein [Calditrichaceae bacterium]RQV92806.1 MAG: hypothetical protein EH224_14265 [Calditrichota bacterium]